MRSCRSARIRGLLYSAEFLERCAGASRPAGSTCNGRRRWRVVETFAAVFPYACCLRPVQVMIGSDRPIPLDEALLAALLRRPDVVAHARRGNPASGGLLPLVAGRHRALGAGHAARRRVLSDMFPRDEFFLNQPLRLLERDFRRAER